MLKVLTIVLIVVLRSSGSYGRTEETIEPRPGDPALRYVLVDSLSLYREIKLPNNKVIRCKVSGNVMYTRIPKNKRDPNYLYLITAGNREFYKVGPIRPEGSLYKSRLKRLQHTKHEPCIPSLPVRVSALSGLENVHFVDFDESDLLVFGLSVSGALSFYPKIKSKTHSAPLKYDNVSRAVKNQCFHHFVKPFDSYVGFFLTYDYKTYGIRSTLEEPILLNEKQVGFYDELHYRSRGCLGK